MDIHVAQGAEGRATVVAADPKVQRDPRVQQARQALWVPWDSLD